MLMDMIFERGIPIDAEEQKENFQQECPEVDKST